MSKITTIYGVIYGMPGSASNNPETFKKIIEHNKKIISDLPIEGEYYDLTRNLFSITASEYGEKGFYKYQMIHFAASYKDLDDVWHKWLNNFENLLHKLHWSEVFLHLDLEWPPKGSKDTSYNYHWKASKSNDKGIEIWVFNEAPRTFKKL